MVNVAEGHDLEQVDCVLRHVEYNRENPTCRLILNGMVNVMAAVILSSVQTRLLRSLELPTDLSTELGYEVLDDVKNNLVHALQQRSIHDRFDGKHNYVNLCISIIHAIEDAVSNESKTEEDEFIAGIFRKKMRIAREVLREADLMELGVGLPGGVPDDEYDWEGSIIGGCLPKYANKSLGSKVVAYVLGRSFDVVVRESECEGIAAELVERFPEDYMYPEEFAWPDIKELIDEQLAEYEEFIPMALEIARQKGAEDGYDYASQINIHFLTREISDRALAQHLEEYE